MVKVIIVDDENLIREGIKSIITQDAEIEVVGLAANGQEALTQCEQLMPDVVLMDILMPICDGVEGTGLIKAKYSNIKILILTTFNDDEKVSKALNNGADGYILKDISSEELILAVKSVAKGLSIMHRNILSNIAKHVKTDITVVTAQPGPAAFNLTEKEMNIIRLIVDGKENKEIAAKLYLSEGSVRNAISVILQKFNLGDRVQLAVFAVKNGLV